jgi:hypothetical protein
MARVSEGITNMRKAQNKRETEKRDLADVVEQEKLIELKGKPCRDVDSGCRLLTLMTTPTQADDPTNSRMFISVPLWTTSVSRLENWKSTRTVCGTMLNPERKSVCRFTAKYIQVYLSFR